MNLEQARSLGLAAAQLLLRRASEPIERVSLLRRMAAMGQIEPSREQRAERQMSDSKAALSSRSLTMGPFEPGSQSQQSVWA